MSEETKIKPRSVFHVFVMPDGNVGLQYEGEAPAAPLGDMLLCADFLKKSAEWAFHKWKREQEAAKQPMIQTPLSAAIPFKR